MNRHTRLVFWFISLAFILACTPVLTTALPTASTLDSSDINRIIAQTANSASTQTAVAIPASTETETPTRIPTSTKTEEPTATNTVIFEFHTPTPFVIPLATWTFGPTSKKDYACQVLDSPVDGTIYDPRLEFKVRWRLKNVGQKEWDGGTVDFVYDTGDRFYKVKEYDLGKGTKIGEVAEIFVELEAPKDPGSYTAYWALRAGTIKFCRVSLTIGVR